jgi:hypothetical protein
MTSEEMQQTIEFILNQQAQFTTNRQKADERVTGIENIPDRPATATLNRFESTDARFIALSEEVDGKFAALVDAQMRTDKAVRNLTAVVVRYFSEGRNGE